MKHRVAAIAYNGLCTFEYGIVTEVFALNREEFEFPWYDFSTCGSELSMQAAGGIKIHTDGGLEQIRCSDTIIIPGWRDWGDPPSQDLLAAISDANNDGKRIISICGGVFVLAKAGVLDGREATTHYRLIDELASRFPNIRVKQNTLYTEDDNIYTSAGSAAGIDLCLHIVMKDFGRYCADLVAQRLIASDIRSGEQIQYQPIEKATLNDSKLSRIMHWLRQDLSKHRSASEIASFAHMSERTLYRRFKACTGLGPLAWFKIQKVNHSKQLLLYSDKSIEEISQICGFSSSEIYRGQFKFYVGTSPLKYRNMKNI